MIKPASSLLVKILCWFFLNLVLVVAALAVFFAFQPQVNLHAIFGQEGSNRLRTTGMLISHGLHQTALASWFEVLARHAAIHKVDFVLVLEDGSRFASKDMDLPEEVTNRVRRALRRKPPPHRGPPPPTVDDPQVRLQDHAVDDIHDLPPSADSEDRHFVEFQLGLVDVGFCSIHGFNEVSSHPQGSFWLCCTFFLSLPGFLCYHF